MTWPGARHKPGVWTLWPLCLPGGHGVERGQSAVRALPGRGLQGGGETPGGASTQGHSAQQDSLPSSQPAARQDTRRILQCTGGVSYLLKNINSLTRS